MLRSILEEEISGENDGDFKELSDISSQYSYDSWSGIPRMRLTDENDENLVSNLTLIYDGKFVEYR